MKKLIAISVMLVLLTGAVFAQAQIGGNMKISTELFGGQGDDNWVGPTSFWDALVNVTWAGDNAGGIIRLYAGAGNDGPKATDHEPLYTYWWWKPIDKLRIQLGVNPDGDFGNSQISGWGFNAEAQGGTAIDEWRWLSGGWGNARSANPSLIARLAGWYGGFGSKGLALSFTPIDILAINLGIPMEGSTGRNGISDGYLKSTINVKVTVPDIGVINVAADLNGFSPVIADDANKENKEYFRAPHLYASFYLMALDGIGIDLGASFKSRFDEGKKKNVYDDNSVGLGFRASFGDFSIKLRAGVALGTEGVSSGFGVNVLPSYNLGNVVVFLNAGFGMMLEGEGDNANPTDWYINPYVRIGANAGNFYTGLKLYGGINKADVKWAIPIGWNVYY